jgi:sugar/nucleoside kinase (ribokinase family)
VTGTDRPATTGGRLLLVGEAVLDVTLAVAALPARGADLVATSATLTPGGGFNVMTAAARQGADVLYAGRHGVGPAGNAVRASLAAEGIAVARPADPDADTGFVVVMVEPDGERTFVTDPGALLSLDAVALAALPVRAGDVVYVSGYGLASPRGDDVAGWIADLGSDVTVVADPGPLVADLPAALLGAVVARADWWSCNRREATVQTGIDDATAAAVDLATRGPRRGGIVVRDGAAGCTVALRDGATAARSPVRVASPAVEVVDTTGAGDTHVGVFVAGLLQGLGPLDAARRATVAAAASVTRAGPARAPGRAELDRWMAGQVG